MPSLQEFFATVHGLLRRICGFPSGQSLLTFLVGTGLVALTEAKEHISEMARRSMFTSSVN
jgi:hypothetical protein